MITHETLVRDLVCTDVSVAECAKFDSCEECCDHMVTEYEDFIRAEAIRKFAEWLQENVHISDGITMVKDVEYTRVISFIELLAEYEKGGKNE